MAWVKIDDHFDEHPKFAKAGPLGIPLWLAGLAYCNRNLTDGFIPWTKARSLIVWQFSDEPGEDGREKLYTVDYSSGMWGDNVTSEMVIGRLLEAGLWEEVVGGYMVHDYGEYQPSKKEVLAERAKWAERKNRERHGRSHGMSHGMSHALPVPVPVPVPVPDPKPEKEKDTDSVHAARARFTKPSFEEVSGYCLERQNVVDPQTFLDHYESNGWRVGRNPMKSWRAAVHTWERNGVQNRGGGEDALGSSRGKGAQLMELGRRMKEAEREQG